VTDSAKTSPPHPSTAAATVPQPLQFEAASGPLCSRMAEGLVGSEILRIAAEIRALKAQGADVLDLTVGDFAADQFRIPNELGSRIADAVAKGETNYPPSNGVAALREAALAWVRRELGLEYPPNGVVVAGGARPLIYATYRALVDPDDVVVYPVPSWNNNHYVHMVGARGVTVRTSPESRFLPTADLLRPHLAGARLLSLCSPLNPTGTAFTAESLAEISRLVVEENRRRGPGQRPLFVMYDQVYWTLTFMKVRHVNPVSLVPEMAPYTILVDGISKAFAATGLRVGFAFGPPAIIARMSDILGHVGAWAPRPEQVATASFLNDTAALEAFRHAFHEGIKLRLASLHRGFRLLEKRGLPVRVMEPMGAIYLTVQFPAAGRKTPDGKVLQTNEDVRKYLLERAGFAVVPFQSFAYSGDDGWFRCSVGAVSSELIDRAMGRLESALSALS
jgi:aspartate aminotransferase